MTSIQIEAAGQWFETYLQGLRGEHADEPQTASITPLASPRGTFDDFYNDNVSLDLLKSDPSHWQKLDQYAVLGLEKLRTKASLEDIRLAHRRRILKYHPDKGLGEHAKYYNGFFKSVNKAFEVLQDADKRKAFECVDPTFDNSVPAVNRTDFFETFGPAIQRNSKWFVKQPVPMLGDMGTPRAAVEKFYSFWRNEKTWREFSFYDEELASAQDNRSERRFTEKKNFAERTKKKEKEAQRMRKLIDNCQNSDPRIALYKQQDSDEKELKKQSRKAT